MPDFHLVRAFGAPDTIIYDPEAFVAAWAALARDLAAIPELEGRLALDFVNEPDGARAALAPTTHRHTMHRRNSL
jgi:hypothetical protein